MSNKTIDTLIEDIRDLVGGRTGLPLLPQDMPGDKIDEALRTNIYRAGEVSRPTLRLSAAGKCPKRVFYEFQEGPKARHNNMRFLLGNLLEELVLSLVAQAGHSVSGEQMEVSVSGIIGHIDAIIDDELVDIKTCSPFAFKKFVDDSWIEDDYLGYASQLAAYSRALGRDRAFILAFEKASGDMVLSELPRSKFPDTKKQLSEQKRASMGDEPERPEFPTKPEKNGNVPLADACRFCPFREQCYEGQLRKFQYSNGIREYVHVEKVPTVPEIIEEDFSIL